MIGPLAGGELLAIASWRWLFLINLPLVVACLALIRAAIPRQAPSALARRRVDVPGAVLCAAGLAGVVFALIEGPRLGWADAGIVGAGAGGALLLAGFVVRERTASDPMLPLSLFRRRNFSGGEPRDVRRLRGARRRTSSSSCVYLQQVGGWSPLHSGLAVLPATVVMFALSRRVGALSGRFGPRLFMGAGPIVAAAGLVLVAPHRPAPAATSRSSCRPCSCSRSGCR